MPGNIDYEKLSGLIADKMVEKIPPCQRLTESDITVLEDLVKKKKLMGKGFLWLLFAVAGMILRDLWHLVGSNLHWGN